VFACLHAPSEVERLLICAQTFSPKVEQTDGDTVTLDIGGLAHLFGTEHDIANAMLRRIGIPVNIAIASNPGAAYHAARGFSGIHVIPHGDEAKYLSSLPIHLLSPPPEIAETLGRWGIRTFRDLAGLPDIGVAARLGEEGIRLQMLARGEGDRPLAPLEAPLRFEEEMDLDYPVELLEPLLFVLARLLGEVCVRLEERALAAIELHLRLKLERASEHMRAIRLPVPMRSPRTFLKLLELDLKEHPPSSPIVKVTISAEPAKPRVTQNGLFIPLSPEPEKLELTLARITALVGPQNVGTPELLDTHRPGAFRIRGAAIQTSNHSASKRGQECLHHLAFRVFRPPKSAKVQAPGGHPTYISSPGIQGKVLAFAGPWRKSGEWWTTEAWSHDEWDIALSDGALYRIYCDWQNGRWFVEGSYD